MKGAIFIILIYLLLLIGWVRCIYKATTCNWDPIGKAEIVYTGGVLLGYGGIVGWIEIEDE